MWKAHITALPELFALNLLVMIQEGGRYLKSCCHFQLMEAICFAWEWQSLRARFWGNHLHQLAACAAGARMVVTDVLPHSWGFQNPAARGFPWEQTSPSPPVLLILALAGCLCWRHEQRRLWKTALLRGKRAPCRAVQGRLIPHQWLIQLREPQPCSCCGVPLLPQRAFVSHLLTPEPPPNLNWLNTVNQNWQ